MAITLKAKKVLGFAGVALGTQTISLTSGWNTTYGSATYTPVENDLVVVSVWNGGTASRDLGVTTADYEEEASGYSNGSTSDTNGALSRKFMGATPDTSVDVTNSGSAAFALGVTLEVWGGVDLSTPLDVALVTASGTGTGQPDPGAITPTTSGSLVLVHAASAQVTGAVLTSSDLANFLSGTRVDTTDVSWGSGDIAWTSGPLDPAAWGGGTTDAGDSWLAFTLALRLGSGTVTGTLAATEADDTAVSAGALALAATLAKTEADETVTATGTVSVAGLGAGVEADETVSATGTLAIAAAFAANDYGDTLTATSVNVLPGRVAAANITEASDTLAATVWRRTFYTSPPRRTVTIEPQRTVVVEPRRRVISARGSRWPD